MLHDDTGNDGEIGKGLSHTLEAKGTPKEVHGGALLILLDGPAELALFFLFFFSETLRVPGVTKHLVHRRDTSSSSWVTSTFQQ